MGVQAFTPSGNTVVSITATSDVASLDSATAGEALLAATAGRFAVLQSDGIN